MSLVLTGTSSGGTIASSSTNVPVVLQDSSGNTNTCQSWTNFNGTSGASPVIRASFNTSSVTRTGTGTYTVAFTNSLVDANYSALISGPNIFTPSSLATTGFTIVSASYTGVATDYSLITTAIFR